MRYEMSRAAEAQDGPKLEMKLINELKSYEMLTEGKLYDVSSMQIPIPAIYFSLHIQEMFRLIWSWGMSFSATIVLHRL